MIPRPKLFVAKCHCGCSRWAAFKTHHLTLDGRGRYREQGMYEDSWRQALRTAIQWTTQPTESLDGVMEP